jgi:hypothetical protein
MPKRQRQRGESCNQNAISQRFQLRGNLNISDVRKLSTLLHKDLKLTRWQSISSKHQLLTLDSPWHRNSLHTDTADTPKISICMVNWRIKNQLDATYYFIVLLIASTCFGHYYVHHQELATIMLITTLVVSFCKGGGGRVNVRTIILH